MLYLFTKAAISGVLVAIVSEIAKRYPTWGGLIASLPLVSVLAMIWLWRDTHDTLRVAALATSTFWFFLPSIPLFLIIPLLLKAGWAFWPTLATGCAVTVALYAGMAALAERMGFGL